MDYIEKTVQKNYIYKGKILSLRCDDALLPNDEPCKREIVEHSGGACVLCVQDGKALFVKQYRYAYGESVLEIPAGKLNVGEDPMLAAKRELKEETGVYGAELTKICTLYPSPGYTNEKIYIYLATGGKKGERQLDEDEFLDVEWIELPRVREMLKKGEFHDSKTIVALQHYFLQNG
jgi:ADP-ribose pyrophosphatase